MAYRKMEPEDLYEYYRRYLKGQSPREIARNMATDPKTVRKYLKLMEATGLNRENPVLERTQGLTICRGLIPVMEKKHTAQDKLEPYKSYLSEIIHDPQEPIKPKTAFLVVKEKYGINISYETFKRFARIHDLQKVQVKQIIRIELPPGREVQIDYGKVGRIYDPVRKHNCDVYAYTGILSYSRYPFIQFVFKQDQVSFANSTIDMFEFYGGVPEFLTIDNLKAGVISPDLFEPKLNRSFADVAEYYGTFINPCRVRTPTDKGKVERMIPVARELFRRYKHVLENPTLESLNRKALEWAQGEYGINPHGTTGIPPLKAYTEVEKPVLKALAEERFEIPLWMNPKVHPDQFIQFENKRYSVPPQYRGKYLWVCRAGPIIRIFNDHELIRQYMVSTRKVSLVDSDFPADKMDMVKADYPSFLIRQAYAVCHEAGELLKTVLMPHAFLNIRRARGVLDVLKTNADHPKLVRVCIRAKSAKIINPKTLKALFEAESKQLEFEDIIPMSEEGRAMVRSTDYYVFDNNAGDDNGNETPPRTEFAAATAAGNSGESDLKT